MMKHGRNKWVMVFLMVALVLTGGLLNIGVNTAGTAQAADTNVALNAIATAIGECGSTTNAAKAVDGSTSTIWCYSSAGAKWLQLDLGQSYNISRWVVKHAATAGECACNNTKDFKLQKSADGVNWTDVDSVTGNSADITDRNVTTFGSRYVRLYITLPGADTYARIAEFEVYGSVGSAPAPGTNLALNQAATAPGDCGAAYSAAKTVDGSTATYWCYNSNADKWLKLDLGQGYNISRWVVKHAATAGECACNNTKDFKLQKSADGVNWTDVDAVTGNTADITDRNVTTFNSRYVRLYITLPGADSYARIAELELYGGAGGPVPTPTPTPTPTPPPGNAATSPLGMNITGVADWMSQQIFVDVFKSARVWTPSSGTLNVDSNGWIASLAAGQTAQTYMLIDIQGHYPQGQYVVLYDGDGTMAFSRSASVASSTPGRIVLNVNGPDGIGLQITSVNSANHLRNIRVIMPGFESTYQSQPFHPTLLNLWQNYKFIRFMDLMKTNFSPIVNWSDRATASYYTQASDKGIAPEYIVQIANTLGKDAWINIPHQATNDYVTQLATYLKNNLNPNLKVYIEYSNEVWNFGFGQAQYALQQGRAAGLGPSDFEATMKWYSRRSVQIFNIFEQVFGGLTRLERVLGSQHVAGAWVSTTVADFENAYQHADALAVAPYFGNELGNARAAEAKNWTLDQLFAELQNNIVPTTGNVTAEHAAVASARGLELWAYEGGQHIVGVNGWENDAQLTNLFISANRDPRMKAIYTQHMNLWRQKGGKYYAAFASIGGYSKWGSWGILEWQDQNPATAPKYQSLAEFITNNPKWW